MKKVIMILMLLLGVVTADAREPYGDYVCRYIVEKGRYHKIYNPIKITHYGIQVKNTNAGTKIWQANYQGPIRLTIMTIKTNKSRWKREIPQLLSH